MIPERLRLRDGLEPARAITVLDDIVQKSQEVGSQRTVLELRRSYLLWIEFAEPQLAGITLDPDVVTMIHTPRFWQLWQLGLDGVAPEWLDRESRAWSLVNGEMALQREALLALKRDVLERVGRAVARPGAPTVIDTNVLLEHQRPDSLPWPQIVGHAAVRLIVPLRAVEELDAKKYDRRADLADRARRLLPWLETTTATGAGSVGASTTIEVLIDRQRRLKPQDADREVLDACHELTQFGGQRVTLVSADTGMLMRARGEDIPAVKMPTEHSRQAVERDAS